MFNLQKHHSFMLTLNATWFTKVQHFSANLQFQMEFYFEVSFCLELFAVRRLPRAEGSASRMYHRYVLFLWSFWSFNPICNHWRGLSSFQTVFLFGNIFPTSRCCASSLPTKVSGPWPYHGRPVRGTQALPPTPHFPVQRSLCLLESERPVHRHNGPYCGSIHRRCRPGAKRVY